MGFYITYPKIQPPSHVTKYLDVIVDSTNMELRLPVEKVVKLKTVLPEVSELKSISKKKLVILVFFVIVLPLLEVADCSAGAFMTCIKS